MHTIRVTSPLDVSPIRSRFHDQDARYLLYLSPCTLPFPGKRFLHGTAPLDAATLAPCTPTHTFTFRPQENARTHAYTPTTRKCNACITRTSTMMSGEFAPGGARMYGSPTIVRYIRSTTCGRSVGFLAVRKCAYIRTRRYDGHMRNLTADGKSTATYGYISLRQRRRRIIIAAGLWLHRAQNRRHVRTIRL